MRAGEWSTCAPGLTKQFVYNVKVTPIPSSQTLTVQWNVAPSFANRYFGVYINDVLAGRVYVSQDAPTGFFLGGYTANSNIISVYIEDFGQWNVSSYNPRFVILEKEAMTAQNIVLGWVANPTIQIQGDVLTQFSGWDFSNPLASPTLLTSLQRFTNCAQDNAHPNWGGLNVVLSTSGGVHTLTLYAGTYPVAQGSRSGDGVVVLTPLNQSGLYCSVTLAYTSDLTLGTVSLVARWPASYQIHYSLNPLGFPRTPEATVIDDRQSNTFHYVSSPVDPGSYYTAVLPVGDDGVVQIVSPTITVVVIHAPPHPPQALQYALTNKVRFYYADNSCKFNVYVSDLSGITNFNIPTVIVDPVSAGWQLVTLPALPPSSTGTIQVTVRAVDRVSGVEEQNGNALTLNYVNSVFVLPAPNTPTVYLSSKVGRALSVTGFYSGINAMSYAVKAQLFVWLDGSSPDLSNPQATRNMPVLSGSSGSATFVLSYTVPTDGFYRFGLKAVAFDGTQSINVVRSRKVYLTNVAPNQIVRYTAIPARG